MFQFRLQVTSGIREVLFRVLEARVQVLGLASGLDYNERSQAPLDVTNYGFLRP